MTTEIPIFVTVRGNTTDLIFQHKESLKFMFLFIQSQDLLNQTYIISDNHSSILEYAKQLGFKNLIYHQCYTERELKYLEYIATYEYALKNNYHPDWFILLNIDQLFLSSTIISDCIRHIDNKFDVVTSYTEISNRSSFFVGVDRQDTHLLTSEHDRVKMGDAAIYAIKTDFAFSCMKNEDPSVAFWNGKVKYFKNNSLYTDIYSINDIYKYYAITELLNKVRTL